jgi:hypothetical protein
VSRCCYIQKTPLTKARQSLSFQLNSKIRGGTNYMPNCAKTVSDNFGVNTSVWKPNFYATYIDADRAPLSKDIHKRWRERTTETNLWRSLIMQTHRFRSQKKESSCSSNHIIHFHFNSTWYKLDWKDRVIITQKPKDLEGILLLFAAGLIRKLKTKCNINCFPDPSFRQIFIAITLHLAKTCQK